MSIISVQSHYGAAATFGIGRGFPSNSISMSQSSNAGIIPSVSAFGGQYSGTSGAIGKIIDIIAGMEGSGSNKVASAAYEVSENEQRSVDRLSHAIERANWTKDDAIEFLIEFVKSDVVANNLNARGAALGEALLNGTATVVDMEEFGYRTEASYNMHFDSEGRYLGGSTSYQRGGDFDLVEFYEKHLIEQPDGMVIDGETGMYSGRVQIGALDLFITWPRESKV